MRKTVLGRGEKKTPKKDKEKKTKKKRVTRRADFIYRESKNRSSPGEMIPASGGGKTRFNGRTWRSRERGVMSDLRPSISFSLIFFPRACRAGGGGGGRGAVLL